jgi:hypothetical protein
VIEDDDGDWVWVNRPQPWEIVLAQTQFSIELAARDSDWSMTRDDPELSYAYAGGSPGMGTAEPEGGVNMEAELPVEDPPAASGELVDYTDQWPCEAAPPPTTPPPPPADGSSPPAAKWQEDSFVITAWGPHPRAKLPAGITVVRVSDENHGEPSNVGHSVHIKNDTTSAFYYGFSGEASSCCNPGEEKFEVVAAPSDAGGESQEASKITLSARFCADR